MGNVDFDAEGNVVAIELFKFSEQVEAWQKQEGQRESEASADLAERSPSLRITVGGPGKCVVENALEVVDAERTRPRRWIWYRSWYRHQRT